MFPAYQAIGKDIQLGYARWRVYMHLVHTPVLTHHTPAEVKVWYLAEALRMSPRKVIDALDWLTTRGYVVAHGRHERRVRCLTLAYVAVPIIIAEPNSPKCNHPPAA